MRRCAALSGLAALGAALFAVSCGQTPSSPTSAANAGPDAAPLPPAFLPIDASTPERVNIFETYCQPVANLGLVTPSVVLVVDGTTAAGDGGIAASNLEWAAMRGAVSDFALAASADGGARRSVGLVVFGDTLDPVGAIYPSAFDVPIRVVDGAQRAAFDARLAGSPTPAAANATPAALAGAYQLLAAQANGENPSVVLLSRSGRLPLTANDEQATWGAVVAAQKAKTSPPVRTFAIGVGAGADPLLHGVAERGDACVGASPGPTQCHRSLDPTGKDEATLRGEIFGALQAATRRAAACVFRSTPLVADAGAIDTEGLSAFVPQKGDWFGFDLGPADGWTPWPASSTGLPRVVILHGEACSWSEGADAPVQLRQGCHGGE